MREQEKERASEIERKGTRKGSEREGLREIGRESEWTREKENWKAKKRE